MGRRTERVLRRTVRGVTRAVDTVTGDILDLDGSKQQAMIDEQRRQEEAALKRQQEAEDAAAKKAAEEKAYSDRVSTSKDKLNQESSLLTPDSTGVGLNDVKTEFQGKLSTKKEDDDLKKLLSR